MALLIPPPEYSGMSKRGPYKKAGPRPPPKAWRRTFLAQWREFRQLTQEELADASGVSVGMISSIEGATSGYSAESLHKLAGALGIEAGMILSVNPERDPSLWALVSQASDKERDQIAKHASVIVTKKSAGKR